MPAHEQQPQDVVPIVALVEDFRGQIVAGIRERVGVGQESDGTVAALDVQGRIAPDRHEPGRRVDRKTFLWPGLQGPKTGFLESLFGGIQVTEIPQQGGNGLRPGAGNRHVDVRGIEHLVTRTVGHRS